MSTSVRFGSGESTSGWRYWNQFRANTSLSVMRPVGLAPLSFWSAWTAYTVFWSWTPSIGPGSKCRSARRCSYACTSGPREPGPTTPPGGGGNAAHGGWTMSVGGGGGGGGSVVVVVVDAAVVVGSARAVLFFSVPRKAVPAKAMPVTSNAAANSDTITGRRKTLLSVELLTSPVRRS